MCKRPAPEMVRTVDLLVVILIGLVCIAASFDCSDKCTDCSEDDRCRHCTLGYYGVNCTPCSTDCINALCYGDWCDEGCIDGRYGKSCNKNCSYCPHGCERWTGKCTDVLGINLPSLSHRRGNEDPLHMGYKILIGFLSFTTVCIILLIVVFVKGKRRRYKRFRQIPRNKHTRTDKAAAAPIWNTTPDTSVPQMTSSFSLNPMTPTSDNGLYMVQCVEQEPLVQPGSDVRIAVSPPSPSSKPKQFDVSQLNYSLWNG